MSEQPHILQQMDDESIKWQYCAICGEQKQRIVRQPGRPDFAFCEHCHAAFVLEDGGKLRMLYGQIPENMPQTRAFALKQWRTYFEIRVTANREQTNEPDILPAELKPAQGVIHGTYADPDEALMKLQAQQSEMFYAREKKLEAPPRVLRETSELPNLDDLFKDPE